MSKIQAQYFIQIFIEINIKQMNNKKSTWV